MNKQLDNINSYLLDGPNVDWLVCRPELTIGAKYLYILLSGMTFKYGEAIPSQKYLSAVFNVSIESLKSYVDELMAFNLIKVHRRLNTSNYYELLFHKWMVDIIFSKDNTIDFDRELSIQVEA